MKKLAAALVVLAACAGQVEPSATTAPTSVVQAPAPLPTVAVKTAVPRAVPNVAPAPTPIPATPTPTATGLRSVELRVPDKLKTDRLAQPRQVALPAGFQLSAFAKGLSGPRFMALGPNNTVYVTGISGGVVYAMHDRGGVADDVQTWTSGLRGPHGVAVHDGYLYVGEEHQVVRFKLGPNGERAGAAETVVPNLPAGAGHRTRTVGFGPDGRLYVAIGSSCNVCDEKDERRAAISVYNGDGSAGRVFARGLRNAVGFVFRPGTAQLWATNNGRDYLGDELPPETLYLVTDGMNAGWPRCNPIGQPDPQFGSPTSCQGVDPPAVTMAAHQAPLGLRFYDGRMFPEQYRGDLFVALHGSWNRTSPTGYKVVRVPFRGGTTPGPVEDFLTGFLPADGTRGGVWARPVDVLVAPDGALLLTDDDGGAIFRISYQVD